MLYRKIPHTDLTVSQIVLGTADYGAGLTEEGALSQLDRFTALGGTFIDTAHCYCDWIPGERSRSEKIIGKWMHSRGERDRVVIATKGGITIQETGEIDIDLSEKALNREIDDSLRNLCTDHIDIYWLHRDIRKIPVTELLSILDRRVRSGDIRYIGCSNWKTDRIAEANKAAVENGLSPFIASQMEWSLARMYAQNKPFDPLLICMDDAMMAFHRETGFPAVAYTSQARGFFAKLASKGESGLSEQLKSNLLNDASRQCLRRIQKLSRVTGLNTTEITVAYITSQVDFPGFPIVASSKPEQFEVTMGARDCRLTRDQLNYLTADL